MIGTTIAQFCCYKISGVPSGATTSKIWSCDAAATVVLQTTSRKSFFFFIEVFFVGFLVLFNPWWQCYQRLVALRPTVHDIATDELTMLPAWGGVVTDITR